MAGSEKDINKIADLITDDPDIFNEMAVGTGDVAFGVVGSVKRKRQANEDDDDLESTKIKKYYADPVTGQSKVKTKGGHSKESGEVMMGDTQKDEDDSLEETRKKKVPSFAGLASKTVDKSTKGAVRSIMQAINSADKHSVPERWDQGLPMPDRRRGAINTGLQSAYSKVLKIVRSLSDLKVGSSCTLFKDWRKYRLYVKSLASTASEFVGDRKRRRGLPPSESTPEWHGNPIQRPPKGWWGHETWNAAEIKNYYQTFLHEVCALYLREAREILTDHVSECENPRCHDRNHTPFLKDLFCGKDSILDFSRSWDKHWVDRGNAIEEFKAMRLNRQKPKIKVEPTADTLKRAKEYEAMSPEERFEIPIHKAFPDEIERLKRWHELYPTQGEADARSEDAGVRVFFDRDLQRTVAGAGPGVRHPSKMRFVRKSSLEH
jgi:hypothetical protein